VNIYIYISVTHTLMQQMENIIHYKSSGRVFVARVWNPNQIWPNTCQMLVCVMCRTILKHIF